MRPGGFFIFEIQKPFKGKTHCPSAVRGALLRRAEKCVAPSKFIALAPADEVPRMRTVKSLR